MTVKEIYEKTKFGKEIKVGIRDYNCTYLGPAEYYLEEYKKAFRKNARYRYREIKDLLDRDAALVENNHDKFDITYSVITRRTFEGAFSKPLKSHEKIIVE